MDLGGVKSGDVVAVWGCGAVGHMAARAAMLLGAERVIAIDRLVYRMEMMEQHIGGDRQLREDHRENRAAGTDRRPGSGRPH